jgi:N-acetylglucosamine kinase-like BadF-type ATPase
MTPESVVRILAAKLHFGCPTADSDAYVACLALMARALITKGAGRLSLVGGMAEAVRPYLPPDVSAHIVPLRADPVDGAIMMARRAAGLEAAW